MRIILYYTIITATIVQVSAKEAFCGGKLNHTLKKFCILHNTPDQRVRRQIVTECCYNKCSVKYLVSNYCQSYDREALNSYLQKLKRKTSNNERSRKYNKPKSPSLERRKRRKAQRCSCKNKIQKKKMLSDKAFLLKRNWAIPTSKLGQIEEAQRPFYVLHRL